MNHYIDEMRRLGALGAKASAESKRRRRRERERALDAQWPRCRDCGDRTHMGLCPRCCD